MERTHEPFVPTYIQADNQQLTPYVSISAISRGKMAEIALQDNYKNVSN